ncbi:hypothetical protein CGZ93_04875 [Enemella dayhoffiae]|uniref:Uncharacterized protein n=1 Tax=Enemella dayhoffiae TaxID=2016507 RepID=A0A255HCU0_9ACTN|nr:hypothetical protein CGZ93_04875 [Enemella dayhoffiae]
MSVTAEQVRVLGIRHHGPGSARAVVRALDAQQPEVVLIEGPPEADALVSLVAEQDLTPPVALMAYAPDDPGRSAFWPLAVFSPEWQALRWAVRRRVPVRFMDLPAATVLAAGDEPEPEPDLLTSRDDDDEADSAVTHGDPVRDDPIAVLARTAGYDDPERWWDDVMELRDGEAIDPFDAVTEAMAALREDHRPRSARATREEERREAHMRKVLRAELRAGRERIAVVCGAWHAPTLTGTLPAATADNKILRGLPKRKVTMTWVPWTHSRLSFTSGYGAGVESPGWYHHLFTAGDEVVPRWLTKVAGVLREHDLPVSSAHVIEAVRLAETLAVLRNRPLPGLSEVTDATLSVLCDGNRLALDLVTRRAVVGERLGTVPESAPGVPLDADLRRTARSLRLKFEAEPRELTLDLRKDNDRARSLLLHRLHVLDIDWAERIEVGTTGTFKEGWELCWRPELSVRLVEASVWGTTVPVAATARLLSRKGSLAQVTDGLEQALRADLPDALAPLVRALDERAAGDTDVNHLLDALPALARAQRYGDVRGTDTSALTAVAQALLQRVCAGLGPVAGGLAEDAARELAQRIEAVHQVLGLLPRGPGHDLWPESLLALVERADVHGVLAGRLVRLLTDAGELSADEAGDWLSRALSRSVAAVDKAAWVEGFLGGGATLLIHDRQLLELLDDWVGRLEPEEFDDVLPLLRRTFGDFAPPERRAIAQQASELGRTGPRQETVAAFGDLELAHAVLARLDALTGVAR